MSSSNKLPSTKTTVERVETLAEKYILLDFLFFKLLPLQRKNSIASYHRNMCRQNYYTLIIQVYLQDTKALSKPTSQLMISSSFQI